MNKTLIIPRFTLIILLLTLASSIYAQDDPDDRHPLLEMLSYVPDIESSQREIYYADMKVSAETAIGEPQDTVQEAWQAMVGYPQIWIGWIPYALPAFNSDLFIMMDDEGQSTGIHVETIERTLSFGSAPRTGIILQGDFDNDAIIAAYTAETHDLQERDDDLTLLCSIEGCDDGMAVHIDNTNPANPFGGRLGRYEPFILLDRVILNSADMETVDTMIEVMDGNAPSLADSPDYQAAIEGAAGYGVLRQAAFFSVALFTDLAPPPESDTPILAQPGFLPAYNLVMFADTADVENDTQAGLAVLVYDNAATARVAQQSIESRLQPDGLESLVTAGSYHKLMTDRGELSVEVIEHPDTERALVVISVSSQLVKMPVIGEDEMPEFTGLQFRLFLNMVLSADTHWLTPDGG